MAVADPQPSPPGATARALVRASDRAALASCLARAEASGWPYASLVLVAATPAAEPLLLLSDLADHSRNIAKDPRVSLLFDGTAGLAEPLTGPRVTLLGEARESREESHRQRFLRRHPGAEFYAGFKDFRFYRVVPESAHLVAGFGRIHWLDAAAVGYDADAAAALAAAEAEIVAHMNQDHADAVMLMAGKLLGCAGAGWTMTGIDPEGIDLRCGGAVARLAFPAPVHDAGAARAALVRLTREARAKD